MTLPPPEICRRILALHELLGFPEGKDEKRVEVLKLLEQHADVEFATRILCRYECQYSDTVAGSRF